MTRDSGSSSSGGPSSDASKDARRRQLTKTVKELKSQLAKLQEDLEKLAPTTKRDGEEENEGRQFADLATKDRVLVWAHDLSVKPQIAYRYRCIASVYNPFYGRHSQLVQEPKQSALANPFVIRSEPSAWSEPVQVTPSSTFFVTGASLDGGPMRFGAAEFEVYRLVEGVRRMQTFTVYPGDRIGKLVEPRRNESGPSVDFTTDWFLVAIVEDAIAEREGDRSKPCIVVVRKVDGSAEISFRSPSQESANQDRQRLMNEANAPPTAAAPPADGASGSGV